MTRDDVDITQRGLVMSNPWGHALSGNSQHHHERVTEI